MDAQHPGLIPPDLADLPALPPRFSWRLPHIKRHRQPRPEGRHIVVDGGGVPVASVQPGVGSATAGVWLHRQLAHERVYRDFEGPNSRAVALRFVARWAELRAAAILAEVDAQRRG